MKYVHFEGEGQGMQGKPVPGSAHLAKSKKSESRPCCSFLLVF
jgi:hypothetical protein